MSIYKNGVGTQNGSPNANILPYSDFSDKTDNEYVYIDTEKTFHGLPTLKITASGFTNNSYKGGNSNASLKNYLTPGEKYTVSIGVFIPSDNNIDVGCEGRMYQRYNGGSSTDGTGFYPGLSSIPTDTGVKYSKVYTIKEDMTDVIFNMNVIRNGTYGIAEPKIEAGEILTEYIPNAQDNIYIGNTHGFIEYDDIVKIQENDYIEANSFIEI